MSKTVSTGYTDTPVDGVSELTFPRAVLNFGTDFRVKANTPGKEVILTNITSPTDQPELIKLCYSEIADIYRGSKVEPTIFTPTKKGVSILAQVNDVISVTDTTDADYRVDLPVQCHLVIKVPMSAEITANVVQTCIGRLLSSLFDTGVETTSRLEAILRGVLVPSDL